MDPLAALVDGKATSLIDMSLMGAQVVSAPVLKPNQRHVMRDKSINRSIDHPRARWNRDVRSDVADSRAFDEDHRVRQHPTALGIGKAPRADRRHPRGGCWAGSVAPMSAHSTNEDATRRLEPPL